MKEKALTDISVLILFHARPNYFSKVWEEVKKAKPTRLFLYQDGPRDEKDMPGIMACRELVDDEQINWECEIHRLYQNKNYGCDPSEFISQRWAFSLTNKCIVLEDDDVPSQSFFLFCKEMLDRYENDERIEIISGFNTDSQTTDIEGGADYFFTRNFAISGWASWSRVVNRWDGNYDFVKNPKTLALLKTKAAKYKQRSNLVQMCIDHASIGKEFYETIFWADMMLHDGLAIMPRLNQINNIGLDSGTHYSAQVQLPKRIRKMFATPRHELQFPLTHPKEVKEHPAYQERCYLLNAWDHPWRKMQYSAEELWLNLIHGNFGTISDAIINRIKKTLGKKKYC
ncbi:MAG: hemolysin activation protein [Prevotellaceae bacterium]|nr:hemolysin activation protein [Candidatus Faecinaster equi]